MPYLFLKYIRNTMNKFDMLYANGWLLYTSFNANDTHIIHPEAYAGHGRLYDYSLVL